MNSNAEKHLAAAKEYVARGDEFYRKAKPEIEAAQQNGANSSEIARFLGKSHTWVTDVLAWDGKGTLYGKDTVRRQADMAKQALRDAEPEQIAEMLDTPEIRANVSRALDTHYRKRATNAATERRERKVADHGGEAEHAEHETRQRLAELVNVMRGAVSALRFGASQAKGLDLADDDTGAAEELAALVEEIVGFGSMLQEYLRGRSITDEDLAQLIGGE